LGLQDTEPLITTIIPTFRRPKLLRRAIRSVLNQTYPFFRVCIYDNASGDETASVVEDFAMRDGRVQYICRAENIGACRNFVDAARRIDTPLFSFLSDDDVLLPNFYKTALAGFEKFPEAMMSATASVHIGERGGIFNIPILNWKPGFYRPPDGMLSMVRNGHPEWTSVLFRRQLLQDIGLPDEQLGGPFDLDFELRAAARFPMAVSLELGALIVIHKDAAGVAGGFEPLSTGCYKIICKINEDETLPASVRSEATRLLSRNIKTILFRSGLSLIVRGNWPEADQAIHYLSSYCQLRVEPFMLRLLSDACRHVGLLRHVLLALLRPYRFVFGSSALPKVNKGLQRRFGCYERCLEL
jgi:hypothetical protein